MTAHYYALVAVCDPAEYDGCFYIECGDSVPAWDERGFDLDGPFETAAVARAAIEVERDHLESRGYKVA